MRDETGAAVLGAPSIYSDGTYLAEHRSWHQEDSPWKAKHVMAMLERNKVAFESLCEVGCGAGEILNVLARAFPGKRLYGYEISPQAFALSRSKERPGLSFRLGDLLAESGESYDVLLAIDVFEHVEDYLGFLKKLKAKAAYKLFHIPLDLSVQSVLRARPILKLRNDVGHLHYFTKETALATLHYAGYDIVDVSYTATAVDLPNRGWKADLMRLPRRALFALSPDWAARLFGGYSLMVLAK
ncbi:class I SAM-dependent methyltransferase [Methyloceanibacter sp.]|uniref:class I SAM-dependent methyltransferase n=1 Tax=Methyloceanibacter sp. TaxID=1965321 RepID=UPI002D2487D4|nr:class I SAM-dependent methyltransferase [Methyloceanibacter sp.]HZP07725.1 class I SAM-dependent methyltransferase [Methyloceanibacter sp.]